MLRAPAPTVESDEDLDALLSHLALMAAAEAAAAADIEQQVTRLKAQAAGELVVQVGREKMSCADWRARAEEAIRQHCEQTPNRERLLGDGKSKTRRFTHGEIAWRARPARLVDLDGQGNTTKAKLLNLRVFGKGGLLGAVLRWLAGFEIAAGVAADRILKFEPKIDRRAILQLAGEKKLGPAWLKSHNLAVETGGEDVLIRPDEQLVQAERRAA